MADGREKRPCIHAGHRQRLKEQFLTRGLDGMPPVQVLELLLFFAIPQGDVNPTAHALLDKFGTLSAVLGAPCEDLLTVKGVGPNAAALLHLIPGLFRCYLADRATLGGQLNTVQQYCEALDPYFVGARVEMCYMLCLDGMNKLIACCKLGEGALNQVNIPQRTVVAAALQHNAARVVLAHNHVSGLALPSQADVEYTRVLKQLLANVGVCLVDHLIIVDAKIAFDDEPGLGDAVSMAQSGYLNG